MNSFLEFHHSMRYLMILFVISPFSVDWKTHKIRSSAIELLFGITCAFSVMLLFYACFYFAVRSNILEDRDLASSITFLLFITTNHSYLMLAIISLFNRKDQINLLLRIDESERIFKENLNDSLPIDEWRNRFIGSIVVASVYDLFVFFTQGIVRHFDQIWHILFRFFFMASNICFTVYLCYLSWFAYFMIGWNEIIFQQFRDELGKRKPRKKKLFMLSMMFERVFELKLLTNDTFSSVFSFSIILHAFSITCWIYVLMKSILYENVIFADYFSTSMTFLFPLLARMFYFANISSVIGAQVGINR